MASFLKTGFKCRCPLCGEGKLYQSYIKVTPRCAACGASFEKVDSGDGPAIFVMMIVGFIVVFSALFVELAYRPDYWIHAALWFPLTVVLTLLLLPVAKSLLISQQFKHDAHESRFTLRHDDDADQS